MIAAIFSLAVAACMLSVVAVARPARAGGSWVEQATRSTVVVHTRDNRSIRGVLLGAHKDALVLGHASYLGAGGIEQLVGEVAVPRDNVAFLQTVPAETP